MFFTFCCIGLLLSSIIVAQLSSGYSFSVHRTRLGLQSALGAALSYPAPSLSPSYSPLRAAYAANISSLAHWQRLTLRNGNAIRQMGLLHSLTSINPTVVNDRKERRMTVL